MMDLNEDKTGRARGHIVAVLLCLLGGLWSGTMGYAIFAQTRTASYVAVTPTARKIGDTFPWYLGADYKYVVDGREYRSQRVVAAWPTMLVHLRHYWTAIAVESELERNPDVYFDPSAPEQAVLIRGVKPWMVWDGSLPLAMFLLGLGGSINWLGSRVAWLNLTSMPRCIDLGLRVGALCPLICTLAYGSILKWVPTSWTPGWVAIGMPWAIGAAVALTICWLRVEEIEG